MCYSLLVLLLFFVWESLGLVELWLWFHNKGSSSKCETLKLVKFVEITQLF